MLRIAWPLFVLNTINDFVEEDTSYISSFRTGEVWRIPCRGARETASSREPGGAKHARAGQDGRAVFLGERPASTS